MSPSPPRSTRPGRSRNRRGVALFVTLAGAGAALVVFGTSPTTALTSTSPAPAAPADSALGDTSQVSQPTEALLPQAAPAAAAVPAAPAAQPESPSMTHGDQAGGSAAQQPAKASEPAAAEHSMSSSTDSCAGLQAAVDAFMTHLNAAHLETSPGQQVTDLLSVDQYVKAHTVLVENMVKPLVAGSDDALGIFLQHVYAAHLEASPGQQVTDLLSVDQYVKTHTVLIENMLAPLAGSDTSSC